ncbi:MAG TPA: hypothetical protein VE996_00835 [Terriglobales bacterium]|nr:hypothetical protein [Terriglobales bacterium]
MEHIDARAVRERLNLIALALANLEAKLDASQRELLGGAQRAVREIAVLVFGDEQEEHGEAPPPSIQADRERIRAGASSAAPDTPETKPADDANSATEA